MRRWRWIVGAVVAVVVVVVAAPFVYIHFIEGPPPPKLALPAIRSTTSTSGPTGTTTSGASAVDGTFNVGAGSQAGYRVDEVLLGQHTTAVGRTSEIWGSVTISGASVTAGTFSVNMASVVSDQSQRNAQFDGRIMDVAQYPTATLRLTEAVALGTVPAVGAQASYSATGELTLHGVTRSVTFPVTVERTTSTIYALADVPITFSDWNIANPSIGGLVTTANSGILEVLVALTTGAGNPASAGSAGASGGGGPGQITVPSTTVPPITIPSS